MSKGWFNLERGPGGLTPNKIENMFNRDFLFYITCDATKGATFWPQKR